MKRGKVKEERRDEGKRGRKGAVRQTTRLTNFLTRVAGDSNRKLTELKIGKQSYQHQNGTMD